MKINKKPDLTYFINVVSGLVCVTEAGQCRIIHFGQLDPLCLSTREITKYPFYRVLVHLLWAGQKLGYFTHHICDVCLGERKP